ALVQAHGAHGAAATDTLAKARAGATALALRPMIDEIDALARRARLKLAVGQAEEPAVPTDDAATELGLTEREVEVLGLVAEGMTNREIGARLFMSDKTASVHVSRILAKLGAANRTEAAAHAH